MADGPARRGIVRLYRGVLTADEYSQHGECKLRISTEDTDKIVEITDPSLSSNLPVRKVQIAGKTVSFYWKDPDGDENQWNLELTGTDVGRLIGVGLPNRLKAEPLPVTKKTGPNPNS